MVPDSRKTLHSGAGLRRLNLPVEVSIEESSSGEPIAVKWLAGSGQAVQAIEGRWRIDDEWWRNEPVSRLYYAVILASGQRVVIYKDLIKASWHRQEY